MSVWGETEIEVPLLFGIGKICEKVPIVLDGLMSTARILYLHYFSFKLAMRPSLP